MTPHWGFWRPGVRARVTLAATAAVALVLLVTGLSFLALLRQNLTTALDAAARERAADVGAIVRTTDLGAAVPASKDEGSLVQVLDPAGRVVAATSNVAGEPALIAPGGLGPGSSTTTVSGLPIGDSTTERYRVVSLDVAGAAGPRTVVVALSLQQADAAVSTARTLLLLTLPLVLGGTAAVAWLGVGRALAPVERIRRGVAEIEGGDVTARVPVPDTGDEVHRLAWTMNAMLDRMQAATERQRQFVADASHELRSPLANLQACLEVALAHCDLDLWQQTGGQLQREQARMSRLVEDLLLLARLDSSPAGQRCEVDLEDVVQEEVSRARRGGRVQLALDPLPAVRVAGDRPALGRVLSNLLDNACRHAAGAVRVTLERQGTEAVVRVVDDGPGVPPADAERIFDRFTRLDDARGRDAGGTGLGLAISRQITTSHGGTLRLVHTGTTGTGAVFELRLPAQPVDHPARTRQPLSR